MGERFSERFCGNVYTYGIFAHIGVVWEVNVGIYGIHGVSESGYVFFCCMSWVNLTAPPKDTLQVSQQSPTGTSRIR